MKVGLNLTPVVFETTHRVRFREVDPHGHMNMANYLTYYGDHRFEGMRQYLGLTLQSLAELPIAFHIRSVGIEYLRPLMSDQEFIIRSYISELKHSQCHVHFAMYDLNNVELSTATMRTACISRDNGRPCRWPPGLMERFFHEPKSD